MPDHKLTKSIGEHYVCAVLAQLGWAASLTRDGLKRTDVLAVDEVGKVIQVQVKTSTTRPQPNWQVGQIARGREAEWYVLVGLGDTVTARPSFWVVPRDHLRAAAWIGHHHWRYDPVVRPGKRSTSIDRARVQADDVASYHEAWELLTRTDVPMLLGRSKREQSEASWVPPLPEGTPWRELYPKWPDDPADAWPPTSYT